MYTAEDKYADEHAQLIYECHHLLNMVMDIYQVEVASISMKVHSEMLEYKILKNLENNSPDEFLSIMKVRIWNQAYKEKNMMKYFNKPTYSKNKNIF